MKSGRKSNFKHNTTNELDTTSFYLLTSVGR